MELKVIAHFRSPFASKFGVPRQSGLAPALRGEVRFLPEYAAADAFRGMEDYSHLWLIWGFSENMERGWSPTVRPPRLGGNARMGVFATRSPFRPNPLGLSCVKLEKVEAGLLLVSGADLMDGTPIYDVKPYIPYADSIPDASGGFTDSQSWEPLRVVFAEGTLNKVPEGQRKALEEVLSCDPRPAYQRDQARRYGFRFAGMDVAFQVEGDCLTVVSVTAKSP